MKSFGKGAHLRVGRWMGMYYHHGIDCGDGSVIHYSGEPAQKASASIERATLDDFAGGGVVEVVYYERSYDPDEVIARAEEMLGEEGYNLVTNNCEHFAAWCKTGEKHSKQIDRMGLVGTTGTVAITSAARLAPLADLLGVVNVGFGLYTAVEVRRQGAMIGRIEDRLDNTYELLSRQYGLLCSIEDTLGRQEKQLDDLLFAMLEGFDSIEDRIHGVTNARREDEYNRLIAALRRARLEVLEDLEHGDAVDARALDKLETAADALLVWADGHLLMQDLHLMARQGLILTHIDAMLTTVDVLMLRDAKRNRKKSSRRVDKLRERIREEVVHLHEGATPWEVLTVIADQVSAYGQVYALLGVVKTHLERGDTIPDAIPTPGWRPVLPSLTVASEHHEEMWHIPVDSLDAFEWFVDAFGLDRSKFKIDGDLSLPSSVVASRLGTSPENVERSAPSSVTTTLLPETWSAYNASLEYRFGVKLEVALRPAQFIDFSSEDRKKLGRFQGYYAPVDTIAINPTTSQRSRLLFGNPFGVGDAVVYISLLKGRFWGFIRIRDGEWQALRGKVKSGNGLEFTYKSVGGETTCVVKNYSRSLHLFDKTRQKAVDIEYRDAGVKIEEQ